MKPTAYLVGAPKAGSSALAFSLDEHPETSLPVVKETNFHCHDLTIAKPKSEAEYLSLYNTTPDTRVLIDASILSLYSKTAAASIHRYCPHAKIFMILRNPIYATYSWHSQMVFTANEPLSSFEEAFAAEGARRQGMLIPAAGTSHNCPQLLYYSEIMKYAEQVGRFLSLFPRDQILILLQDEFLTFPQQTYDRILQFLGLSQFTPQFKAVNTHKTRQFAKLYAILKRFSAEPAKKLLPLRLHLNIIMTIEKMTSANAEKVRMSRHTYGRIREEFLEDIVKLETISGLNLENWKVTTGPTEGT